MPKKTGWRSFAKIRLILTVSLSTFRSEWAARAHSRSLGIFSLMLASPKQYRNRLKLKGILTYTKLDQGISVCTRKIICVVVHHATFLGKGHCYSKKFRPMLIGWNPSVKLANPQNTCNVENVERLEHSLVLRHVLPEGQVVHQHRHQLRHRHQWRADKDKPKMKKVKDDTVCCCCLPCDHLRK